MSGRRLSWSWSLTRKAGYDAAVAVDGLALIMQFKGKMTGMAAAQPGGDESMGPGLVDKYLKAMAEKSRRRGGGGWGARCGVAHRSFRRAPSVATVLTASSTAGLDHRATEAAATFAELEVKVTVAVTSPQDRLLHTTITHRTGCRRQGAAGCCNQCTERAGWIVQRGKGRTIGGSGADAQCASVRAEARLPPSLTQRLHPLLTQLCPRASRTG